MARRWRRSFPASRAAPTGSRRPTIRRLAFSSSPPTSGEWVARTEFRCTPIVWREVQPKRLGFEPTQQLNWSHFAKEHGVTPGGTPRLPTATGLAGRHALVAL